MKKPIRLLVTVATIFSVVINIGVFVYIVGKEEDIHTVQSSSYPETVNKKENNSRLSLWANLLLFLTELQDVPLRDLEPILLSPVSQVKRKLVFGIPVADREKDYIIETLSSLFKELDENYRSDSLFLVMFASMNITTSSVWNRSAEIKERYAKEIAEGLLQIIAIPPAWYTINLAAIPATFNDSAERMFWRTKQNIDYIYIMTYANSLGDYYMQLEDDILAAPGYARIIFNYLAFYAQRQWFLMEFSFIGFIGKLFRSEDLKFFTHSIALYYRFKPVDWILMDVLKSRYCTPEACANCSKAIQCYKLHSGTSQFQHVGKISSLTGKIQEIYDGLFGSGKAMGSRGNPPAIVYSSTATYKDYEPQKGYDKNFAIWLVNVTEKSYVSIEFKKTMNVTGIMFISGVTPSPQDKFGPETKVYAYDEANDRTKLGEFSSSGEYMFHSSGTLIRKLQIEVTENISHWVIIDHIRINISPECIT